MEREPGNKVRRSSRLRHRNQLTVKAWEKAVQELGKVLSWCAQSSCSGSVLVRRLVSALRLSVRHDVRSNVATHGLRTCFIFCVCALIF